MILNNQNGTGNRVPAVRLVEPKITIGTKTITGRGTETVEYIAEYEVNRNCVLVGYCDRREAQNIFRLLSGIPELDYTVLLNQYGVIKILNRKATGTITTDGDGEETTIWDATEEQLINELKNIVCVIIE